MKKNLLIVITLFSFLTGYSQTEKGKMFAGVQLNLTHSSQSQYTYVPYGNYDIKSDIKTLQFQFLPGIGYFIKDNLAIGLNLNFGASSQDRTSGDSPSKINTINYGGGGIVRHYSKIIDKFYFITDGGLSYTFTQNSLKDPSGPPYEKIRFNNISLTIAPGLVYFVTTKLGLQVSFGNIFYNTAKSKSNMSQYTNHSNNYGISLNMSTLNFGLSYYF